MSAMPQLQLLAKRLLSGLSEFERVRTMVFETPVELLLKGFFLERSSVRSGFYIWVFFIPLCVPTRHIHFNFGERLSGPKGQLWNTDEPGFETALIDAIRHEGQRFLSNLQSPVDVAAELERRCAKSHDPHACEAAAYMFIRGHQLARAQKAFDELFSILDLAVPWQHNIAFRAAQLREMVTRDVGDAQSQLRAWEAQSVQSLGVAKFASTKPVP